MAKNFCVGIRALFVAGVFSFPRSLPIQDEQEVLDAEE